MEITDVRVKLVRRGEERLKASCTVTLDGEFVIRDVKVIEGSNGLFVAMPSRKISDHCPRCRHKNHLRARYCNHCGAELNHERSPRGGSRPMQLHVEVAHPINSDCRDRLQDRVLSAYEEECKLGGDDPGRRDAPVRDTVEHDSAERESRRDRQPRPAAATVADDHDADWNVSSGADPMSDYKSLVDELKSEAQQRRGPDTSRDRVRTDDTASFSEPAAASFEADDEVAVDEEPDDTRQPAPATDDDDFAAGLL